MMRIFYTNPNGIGSDSYEKVEMLKRQIRSNQIDLLIESRLRDQRVYYRLSSKLEAVNQQ